MSHAPQSRCTEPIGYLALTYAGERLPLELRRSTAGYFIGTADDRGPASRESFDYFCSH
ncbi:MULTISPECIES: hypothetical protein [Stutzerimonas]|uniref:hypothetical protein n=1 Tax=Stutzerimonas TaxID=2901164 RepID=UPI0015E31E28|nr:MULTISPECIES: hypothetical protein [Stutzerimonas]MBA1262589.1 hypothetical protein [Stutzerimonas stutzeri]